MNEAKEVRHARNEQHQDKRKDDVFYHSFHAPSFHHIKIYLALHLHWKETTSFNILERQRDYLNDD